MTAIPIGDTSESQDVQVLHLMITESAWKGSGSAELKFQTLI